MQQIKNNAEVNEARKPMILFHVNSRMKNFVEKTLLTFYSASFS